MYNKSEIMKSAWNKFRTGYYETFAAALCQAWREAKANRGTVRADQLNVGDTVRIEYGDYGNMVTCMITGISSELFLGIYCKITAISGDLQINFCIKADEKVRKIEMKVAA